MGSRHEYQTVLTRRLIFKKVTHVNVTQHQRSLIVMTCTVIVSLFFSLPREETGGTRLGSGPQVSGPCCIFQVSPKQQQGGASTSTWDVVRPSGKVKVQSLDRGDGECRQEAALWVQDLTTLRSAEITSPFWTRFLYL